MSEHGTGTPAPQAEDDSRLRCNIQFAALVLVLLPVLVGLGFWQLWRSGEKAEVLALLEARRGADPVGIAAARFEDPAAIDRLQVELRGQYVEGRDFLLDNRLFGGRVGYELISPFSDDSGIVVLVNRGWLQAGRTREELPRVEPLSGRVSLRGEIYVPQDRRRLQLYASAGWPKLVQAVDPPQMGSIAGVEMYPWLVRLHPGQPGVTEADWPAVNIQPERHVAYAVQWFLMAVALVAVFLLGGTNVLAWHRHKRKHGDSR
jgi:surfeit locus 1 family protein